jgi:hypothetical protein
MIIPTPWSPWFDQLPLRVPRPKLNVGSSTSTGTMHVSTFSWSRELHIVLSRLIPTGKAGILALKGRKHRNVAATVRELTAKYPVFLVV